jgi:imidazolonepropionase-like amidohydrolase
MVRWYSPAEALKMATAGNVALPVLSGLRSPYLGKHGVVKEGALADLLVDSDPIADINRLAGPAKILLVIMRDGKIYKNLAGTTASH